LIERGIDARELEVGVLGNDDPIASVVGEIVPGAEFYDYRAKYLDAGSQALIPADISRELSDEVRRSAVEAFKAIDGAGLARVDFFLDRRSGALYLNEINTMPGFTEISMYPKLWEASVFVCRAGDPHRRAGPGALCRALAQSNDVFGRVTLRVLLAGGGSGARPRPFWRSRKP